MSPQAFGRSAGSSSPSRHLTAIREKMANHLTRAIDREVERELWARAAGRCEFSGCNKLLYLNPLTKESINISEKAHIYSFAESGPRGRGNLPSTQEALNGQENLML